MPHIHTRIVTPLAGRTLVMLCRHFSRKVPAEYSEHAGRVDFQPGLCRMFATEDALTLHCEASDEPALLRVRQIVEGHLTGFGRKQDPVTIVWAEGVG